MRCVAASRNGKFFAEGELVDTIPPGVPVTLEQAEEYFEDRSMCGSVVQVRRLVIQKEYRDKFGISETSYVVVPDVPGYHIVFAN